MRLLDLLRKLAVLGDKLPEAMAIISRLADVLKDGLQLAELPDIFADAKALLDLFAARSASMVTFGLSESEEEESLISLIAEYCDVNPHRCLMGTPDGHRIKNVVQFLKDHPEILAIILGLL